MPDSEDNKPAKIIAGKRPVLGKLAGRTVQARPLPLSKSSMMFPAVDTPSAGEGKDVKPKGPGQDVITRVRKAKKNLESSKKELDQNVGAYPSIDSPSRFARKDTTFSQKTSGSYKKRGQGLIKRYRREQGFEDEFDVLDSKEFVQWLLSLKPSLESSTWRVYRQAAYHTIMARPDPDIEDALKMLEDDVIEGDEGAGKKRQSDASAARRTSSMKAKNFPREDFKRMLAFLKYRSKSKMSTIAHDWLVASIHTGLRPVEWRATAFEAYQNPKTHEKYVWLHVLNAKTTNSRGNGTVRTLDLSALPNEVLMTIKRMSENGLLWYEEGRYGNVQSQISQIIYQAGAQIFPRRRKHYALYSCRHQFIANMKTVMTPEEVSALSGHVVTKTAKQNYGKSRSAWQPHEIMNHAKPMPDEVATVRTSYNLFLARHQHLQEAGVIHGNAQPDFN